MRSGKLNRRNILMLLNSLFLFLIAGCSLFAQSSKNKQKPGFYNLLGWNSSPVNLSTNEASTLDIDGKVGYKMELSKPTANCVSPSNKWTGFTRIISGEFPPGVYIEDGVSIRGTPEQRGHYIAVVELYEIKCNDNNYLPIRQELRFHITGSGVVNEGDIKELINSPKLSVTYLVTQNDVKFFCKSNCGWLKIYVDVNQNGIIDPRYDRQYGSNEHKLLCTRFITDDLGNTSDCGEPPSNAKLAISSSLYVFTIPKSELSNGTGTAAIRFMSIYALEAGLAYTEFFPAAEGLEYKRIFENIYKIDIQ